jgi:peptidoglycan/xylan/chitin deacetylase (PgdA/CDA1 family)
MECPKRRKHLKNAERIAKSRGQNVIRTIVLPLTLVATIILLNSAAYAQPDITSILLTERKITNVTKDSGDLHVSTAIMDATPEATPVPYAMDTSAAYETPPDPTLDATGVKKPSDLAAVPKNALPAPDGVERRVRVPILMYHYISDPPKGANDIRRDLSLPGPDFELQLRYLVNEGYHSISMQDLIMHIQQGTPLPEKPIILTFDDGYKDAFTVAVPLLKKYGFTGTFFIFTQPIMKENRDYLSWQEIELMSAAGMEIGSHSASHPDLREQPDDVLMSEIVDSKKEIEAHIHKPVRSFCYPANTYNSGVIQKVQEAGYWAAVTTQQGVEHTSDNRLLLRRVRVRGESGLERFHAALNADW